MFSKKLSFRNLRFISKVLAEAKACLLLAIPLAAAQLAQAGTNFFDTVMMGLLGSQSLAAGALGAVTFSALMLISTGIVSSVGILAAVADGAGESKQVSCVAVQGLWLSIALSIPFMLLIWNMGPILRQFGQEPSNVILAESYLRAIVWGFPASMGFAVLKNVVSALNRPRVVMVIMVGGVFLNVAANYVLMFGLWGLPALGLAGIGWGSTLSYWVMFATAVGFVSFNEHFKSYQIFPYFHQFNRRTFWEIFQIGWPIGLLFTFEAGLFAATTFLMGYLGTVTLAAHQIALQTAAMTFMVPVGISYATTIRVGQSIGKNDPKGAQQAGYVGIAIGAIFMGMMAVIFWIFPERIVGIYLNVKAPENLEVVKLAISLLGVAAMFQIFDGIQVIAAGALRGLKDTRVPMLIGVFAYWIVGFVSGYMMGIYLDWGGVGLWGGLALGLAFASGILSWRFRHLVLRMSKEDFLTADERR
ncbi:MATE family efflux transporter [Microcoleus sp. FACHB-68]|uniref:MATE family efflux transporter n=1 Tax=Microcoleus sp. FACHB-68 TaxID=2692826 RepID=UPI001681E57A|nr:MATE family efflux transporter [Microcoleus sp. FACHB-68]MBD1937279.1 MATE family efflux transporter [Microcoleus sp. FACHB-68]